jgi:hypothetical protein
MKTTHKLTVLIATLTLAVSCDNSTTTCPTDVCAGHCCAVGEVCEHRQDAGEDRCVATCVDSSGCDSGCCAPLPDLMNNPVGPYVCREADDGLAYGCCAPNTCDSLTCCVVDPRGNQFCALPCDGDDLCGSFTHCHFDYELVGTCPAGRSGSCGP